MRAAERIYHEVEEFGRLALRPGQLSEAAVERLLGELRDKVELEFPTRKTGRRWILRPRGHVGTLHLDARTGLRIRPKVPIQNLLRMLEYAYRVPLDLGESDSPSDDLEEFYSRLAKVLALRVRERAHRGLYRSYVGNQGRLPYLRGRLDLASHQARPWQVALPCHYQEHTADVDDNRILAHTLRVVARSSACSDQARRAVVQGYNTIRAQVSPQHYRGEDCEARSYNRLNEDYRQLHLLCAFFLRCAGPSHEAGDRRMMPFLLPMAQLFESFFAAWLREQVGERFRVREQAPAGFGPSDHSRFHVDVTLEDRESGQVVAVLDTKYKRSGVSSADFHQIHSYARLTGCSQAVLVYPTPPGEELDTQVDGVRIRSLVLDLGLPLELAGARLLERLDLIQVQLDPRH